MIHNITASEEQEYDAIQAEREHTMLYTVLTEGDAAFPANYDAYYHGIEPVSMDMSESYDIAMRDAQYAQQCDERRKQAVADLPF